MSEIGKIEYISGKQIALPKGRHVFVAEAPGSYLIEFRSKEGSITRLCLSDEAVSALTMLARAQPLKDADIASEVKEKHLKSMWQLVPRQEA